MGDNWARFCQGDGRFSAIIYANLEINCQIIPQGICYIHSSNVCVCSERNGLGIGKTEGWRQKEKDREMEGER